MTPFGRRSRALIAIAILLLGWSLLSGQFFVPGRSGLYLNVREFGARGDGVADDQPAIQAAIDAASAVTINRPIIFFPPGEYRLASGVLINTSDITLLGSNRYSFLNHIGTDSAITFGDGIASKNFCHVEKLRIGGTSVGSAAIRVRNYQRCTFRDLSLQNYTSATAGIDGEGGAGIKFETAIIHSIERSELSGNKNGVWTRGAAGFINAINIINSFIEANTNAGIFIGQGNGYHISGNTIESSSYGIFIDAARAVTIHGNYFESTTTSAIEVTSSLTVGLSIQGNLFSGGSAQEIYIKGGRGWSIRGNAFQAASTNALIRVNAANSAAYGEIGANGIDSGMAAHTFFLNDGGTLQHIAIQEVSDGSKLLNLEASQGALVVPRMTTTQRDALTAVDGMIVYNTTTGAMNKRQAGAWVAF